jgi:hypothetical protein
MGQDVCICEAVGCDVVGCSICAAPGVCEFAVPRRYRIAPISAQVPTTQPSGDSWDVGGGAPDLYATVSVDGVSVLAMTAVGTDSFEITWSGARADANLVAGSRIAVTLFDQDAVDDDEAFFCEWTATPALLRSRALACEGVLGSLFALVLPL